MGVKFEGRLAKAGRHWAVWVPALEVYTQGRSQQDALIMLKDAVESLVDRRGFSVQVDPLTDRRFIVQTRQGRGERYLIALLLKNQRAKYGLSLQEVADRLGVSKNAYAQYEQARAVPSVAKIEAFVSAMSRRAHVVLDVLEMPVTTRPVRRTTGGRRASVRRMAAMREPVQSTSRLKRATVRNRLGV